MRLFLFVFLISLSTLIASCALQAVGGGEKSEPSPSQPAADGNRHPVLVELFTSEGCSSCPPADRNLTFLETQQPVTGADSITLAFHVDYWDRLGWKDRFSSPLFSRRQEEYTRAFHLDSNYTPQMIVDGQAQFVGSDSGVSVKEISKAAEFVKASIAVTMDGKDLKVKITDVPDHTDATVYAAIAEDGISSRVERGENSGKTLEHVSVVRELKTIGTLAPEKKSFEATFEVQAPADAKAENLKVVVFVQENKSRKVIGVARAKLSVR
ncbi:MAG: DUF1223 domain-containing protein [Acidobacteriota bacterium]